MRIVSSQGKPESAPNWLSFTQCLVGLGFDSLSNQTNNFRVVPEAIFSKRATNIKGKVEHNIDCA